jgi:putative membrane protein
MLPLQVLADVDWDHMDGGWVLMMIGMVLFWGIVIVLLVWLLRGGLDRTSLHKPSPLDILDRRFAEGEITAEEYRERRGILERTRDT